MATIQLKNVKKIYDQQVVAVHDFNLDIQDKEFIVFVGPSGCGKSTVLRMIAGLEEISEGTIEMDGEVVNDLQPKDRDIAMVFQNYALYPHLTVYENMAFSLRLMKNPKLSEDEIFERILHASKILGIEQYLLRKPKALSGGQRQCVAIGRAMVRNARVLLMDEPLSNPDAKLRNQMRAELIELRKQIDSTIIYVTHDQTEAMTLGDRIVIMKDGLIQQADTPQKVFDQPRNLFVAGFIGAPQMNFFDAILKKEGNQYYVECEGKKFFVGEKKSKVLLEKGIEERNIILGVRPEHIHLSKTDEEGITCTISVKEMLGSEYHIHSLTPSNKEIIIRLSTSSLSQAQKEAIQAHGKMDICFEGKTMHFFDKDSGENILLA